MNQVYDKYYQTENLFGSPYPELIKFFADLPMRGKVLDVGCGQGRNAIALARCGYTVVGIDNSLVGINQMMRIGNDEKLILTGQLEDIYSFDKFHEFDIVLMDNMLHFYKKDIEKEKELIKKIVKELKTQSILVICIQDTGNKVQILNQTLDFHSPLYRIEEKKFQHTFEDKKHQTSTETNFRMIAVKK